MSGRPEKKRVDWIGSSLDELRSFHDAIQQSFGFELYQLQLGKLPKSAKPLKGKDLARISHKGSALSKDTAKESCSKLLKHSNSMVLEFWTRIRSRIA